MVQREKADLLQEKRELLKQAAELSKKRVQVVEKNKEEVKTKLYRSDDTTRYFARKVVDDALDGINNRVDVINKKLGIEPTLK